MTDIITSIVFMIVMLCSVWESLCWSLLIREKMSKEAKRKVYTMTAIPILIVVVLIIGYFMC